MSSTTKACALGLALLAAVTVACGDSGSDAKTQAAVTSLCPHPLGGLGVMFRKSITFAGFREEAPDIGAAQPSGRHTRGPIGLDRRSCI